MIDARWQKLADVLVHHSVRVQPGERVLIEAFDIPAEFVALLMRTVHAAGGEAIPLIKQTSVLRALYQHASEAQIKFIAGLERAQMEGVQGYIGLRGAPNYAEMSDVPQEQMQLVRQHWWVPVHQEVRVPKTRWVVLRWPTPAKPSSLHSQKRAVQAAMERPTAARVRRLQSLQRAAVSKTLSVSP
jgi:aminopeptidase